MLHQAIIRMNAGLLFIGLLGICIEIWIKIQNFLLQNQIENAICKNGGHFLLEFVMNKDNKMLNGMHSGNVIIA